MKKRTFIKLAGTVGAGMMIAPLASCGGKNSADAPKVKGSRPQPFLFEQEPLGYDFAALSPAIDPITMEIHYGKHHAGYVTKLNRALHSVQGMEEEVSLVELLKGLKPGDTALRNNGGGHYNHTLYWRTLAPGGAPSPEGDLKKELADTFGSLDAFEKEFATAAATRFGSGWAWLMRDSSGALSVTSTPNQDNPLMNGIVESAGTPLLGIDVWEHAYYLNYQNNRKAYISAFMERINWDVVAANDQA
ncbi:MAG: superoxide dismutase [Crocinitomicaceae bacterium]|jgi:Fe-Mn family superoxide dismutase|nr:superoxide dismutase [Crocinitomicaceae bacterium]